MLEPQVIYEDENFFAINKPANLLVHRAKISNNQFPISKELTLADWLLKKYPAISSVGDPSTHSTGLRVALNGVERATSFPRHCSGQAGQANLRPGIVHRLDKGTSGVMLVAKNQKYFEYLKSLFKKHQIKKTYLALVLGRLRHKTGIINKAIGIKSGTLKRSIRSDKMLKEAITEYRVIKNFQFPISNFQTNSKFQTSNPRFHDLTLIEVYPKTGRTHQIRVHLASIGHPVVGDRLYGPKKQLGLAKRLMLHAMSLEFEVEGGRRIKIEAEPPRSFTDFLQELT